MPNPYVGPRTFSRAESHLFFGRDLEANDLLSLVLSERLILFYAQSGAGKSSLLNTRLIPALEENDFFVLPVGRVSGEMIDLPAEDQLQNIYIYNLLLSLSSQSEEEAPPVGPDTTLAQYLHALEWSDDEEPEAGEDEYELLPQALIIDQFEEIVTTNPEFWQQRANFFEQLRQAMEADKRLWVVLTMREDYVAALDPYAHLLPGNLRARFYMQRMQAGAALQAITEPARLRGKEFTQAAAEMLVNNLRQIRTQDPAGGQLAVIGQFVEPVQLQVVCYQLWENLEDRTKTEITETDLLQLAGGEELAQFVDEALAQFYEQAIGEVAAGSPDQTEFELRNWFESKLITANKTRALILQDPRTHQTGGLADPVVSALENRFLLRAESRAGSRWYELVHDRFVEPILQANAKWRQDHPLIQAARDWKNSGEPDSKLYEGQQLAAALSDPDAKIGLVREFLQAGQAAEAHREQIREAEQQARTNRILKWASLFIGLVGILAIVAALIAFAQSQIASRALTEADDARQTAEANEALAQVEADRAATGEAEARAAREEALQSADLAATRAAEARAAEATAVFAEATALAAEADAREAQTEAEIQRDIASSRRLAALARTALTTNPQQGLLLAIEAISQSHTSQAEESLRQAIQDSRTRLILNAHSDQVNVLAFEPDGEILASGGNDGAVYIWAVNDGELIATYPHPNSELFFAQFGEDNQLTTGSRDGRVRAAAFDWQPEELFHHQAEMTAMSRSGDLLATGGTDGLAMVQNLAGDLFILEAHTGAIQAAIFSPDGSRLVTAGADGAAYLWDPLTGQQIADLSGEGSPIKAAIFSPDGRYVATGDSDGYLYLWDGSDGAEVDTFQWSSASITALAFNPAATRLAAGSEGGGVALWNLETGRWANTAYNHSFQINALAFSPDGSWLASGGVDSMVRLWDGVSGQLRSTLEGHKASVNDLQFSPDGALLATASSDKTIRVWEIGGGEPYPVIYSPSSGAYILPLSIYGNILVTAGFEADPDDSMVITGTLEMWDISSAFTAGLDEPVVSLLLPEEAIFGTAFSPDGSLLATAGIFVRERGDMVETLIQLWDTDQLQAGEGRTAEAAQLRGGKGAILGLAFSPDSRRLATASIGDAFGVAGDKMVKIWDMEATLNSNGRDVHPLNLVGGQEGTLFVDFSPDGTLLAATAGPDGLWVWDMESLEQMIGQTAAEAETELMPIQVQLMALGVDFHPGGEFLAVTDETGIVLLDISELLTGTNPAQMTTGWGHEEEIINLAFSPNGSWLATGGADDTVRLWDMASILSGESSETGVILGQHDGDVFQLAFDSSGATLATAGEDNTIRLWPLSLDVLQDLACAQADRNLDQDEWSAAFGRDVPYRQTCPNLPVHPTVIDYMVEQGLSQVRSGQIQEGVALLSQARQLEPDLTDPELLAAEELLDQAIQSGGADDQTLILLSQARTLDPSLESDEEAARLEGEVYARQGQVELALAALREGEIEQPEELVAEWMIDQGHYLADHEEVDQALDMMERAAELAPSLSIEPEKEVAAVLVRKARSSEHRDHWDEVLSLLRQANQLDPARELDPERETALNLLEGGREDAARTDVAEALDKLQQARRLDSLLEIEPEKEVARIIAIQVDREMLEYDPPKADELLHMLQELDPSLDINPEAMLTLGEALRLAHGGRVEDALEALYRVIQLDPGLEINPEAEVASILQEEAELHIDEAEYEEALHLLRRAGELDPNLEIVPDARIARARGKALADQGQPEEALTAYREAVSLDPSLSLDPEAAVAEALVERGYRYAYEGETDQARDAFDQALDLHPTLAIVPEAQLALAEGENYLDQGQYSLAYPKYEDALALNPQLVLSPTFILAESYGSLCGNYSGSETTPADLCRQAVSLTLRLDNFSLNNGLCSLSSRNTEMADIVVPVCEQAASLALAANEVELLHQVCQNRAVTAGIEPACQQLSELARPITPGEMVEGEIEAGQAQVWQFTGQADQEVVITMIGLDDDMEIELTLVGPDHQPILSDYEHTSHARLEVKLPESGPYLILTDAYSSDGPYTLWLR